jgi:hypothetical protein
MATEDVNKTPSEGKKQEPQLPDKGRRDALKTLATIPVLGALAIGVYERQKDLMRSRDISDVFSLKRDLHYIEPQPNGKRLRIGLVGFGIRGKQLMRAAGFC